MTELHRDIGRHDAQIESLQAQVANLHKDMSAVLGELQSINRTLSEARGGWRTLLAIGGFSGAITAAAVEIVRIFVK